MLCFGATTLDSSVTWKDTDHSYIFTSGHLLFLEGTPFLKIQKCGKNKIEVLITLASSNVLFYSFGMLLPVFFLVY